MKVRFAISLDAGRVEPGHLASLVTGAEERGFDTLWFADLPLVNTAEPTLAVAFAAGLSRRLRLGVDLVPFGHESFVVARQLAQLDQLTGGRLLVTIVPGLDLAGERAALGIAGRDRGRLLDSLLPELRKWWAGSAVKVGTGEATAEVTLPVLPRQDPLEIWLGGHGPQAVRRAGRLADGWLGSGAALGPRQAGELCRRIKEEAAEAGREIDPGHFGLSIRYARAPDDLTRLAPGLSPRPPTRVRHRHLRSGPAHCGTWSGSWSRRGCRSSWCAGLLPLPRGPMSSTGSPMRYSTYKPELCGRRPYLPTPASALR